MIAFLIAVVVLGLGILFVILDSGHFDSMGVTGIIMTGFGGIAVLIMGLMIALVPASATTFEARYDATVQTLEYARETGTSDMERAGTLTVAVELNTRIQTHRVWRASPWVSAFYSQRIADMEFIR